MLGVKVDASMLGSKSTTRDMCYYERVTSHINAIRTVFSFGLYLDQHLALTHYLHNLAYITPRFMQQVQLLP